MNTISLRISLITGYKEKDMKMKIVNITQNENQIQSDLSAVVTVAPVAEQQNDSLAWNDVVIYDEMADQTSVRMNLIQQIQKQMAQLNEMTARRNFLTKEIMVYIVK